MAKRNKINFREFFIYSVLGIVFILLLGRLLYLHVIFAPELKARAAMLHNSNQPVMIYERGMIVDAQDNILAKSVPTRDIYADPKTMTASLTKSNSDMTEEELKAKKKEIAEKLADILDKDSEDILNLLLQNSSWVSIARQADIEKANRVAELKIPGVGFTDTYKSVYPAGTMAASVLGIVNMAGDGVEGLEYYYNDELNGDVDFKVEDSKTADGYLSLAQDNVQTGFNLKLTLDSTIQHLIEQELDSIMENGQPARATILAMDPMTGKILGMGSRPTFDPNNYGQTKEEQRKNLAISMNYEPGSTFKIITGAIALEEGVVTPEKKFNDPGYIIVGSRRITNWDSYRKAHGVISFTEGMKLSSNVVLAQVVADLGKDTFYTYLKSFGFGSKTKIDIAGEEQGLLIDKKNVKSLELATMSFGQANLVTPIQLLTAICAVANGGNLMQPYIVEKITDQDHRPIVTKNPKVERQVLSRTTSKTMTDILVEVVESGTGTSSKILGIKVAGKTGTAQKIDPQTGGYSKTDFVTSFVGFAPADNPKIAVLVIVDSPTKGIPQGGTQAGPHVKAIIEGALQYYGIPVSSQTPSDISNLEDLPSIENPQEEPVIPEGTPGKDEVVVPNVLGLTMRQAGQKLGESGLRYEFSGSGLAINQFPQAGKIINQGDTVKVEFSPEGPN
ncbi:MAG: PASTA domain-containing protein, partial [Peptococcaceae bacterium]|nr:PASTA domain-containing protein [Peptococcaceae bacterium]